MRAETRTTTCGPIKLKAPCIGCQHETESKRRFQACIDCEARIEYANAVTGPIAEPTEFRNPNGSNGDKEESHIEASPPAGMKLCIECGKLMLPEEFKRPGRGPHFRKCTACRQDKKPGRVQMDAVTVVPAASKPAKVNGSAVPEGFVRYVHGVRSGEEFVTIIKRGVVLSAAIVKRLGSPARVDIYFNQDTRQIGIIANHDGEVGDSLRLFVKRGVGTATCSRLLSENRIKPARRVPVEWNGEFLMTKEGAITE